jgi:hypothetical protein
MILRIDKLAIDLPQPKNPSPNSAAAIQELRGRARMSFRVAT